MNRWRYNCQLNIQKKKFRATVRPVLCKGRGKPDDKPISQLFHKLPKYKKIVTYYEELLGLNLDNTTLSSIELGEIMYLKWKNNYKINIEEQKHLILITIEGNLVSDIEEYENICQILNENKQSFNFVHFIILNENTKGPVAGKMFNSGAIFLTLKKVDNKYVDYEWVE